MKNERLIIKCLEELGKEFNIPMHIAKDGSDYIVVNESFYISETEVPDPLTGVRDGYLVEGTVIYPATHYEPEDASEYEIGKYPTVTSATWAVISAMLDDKANNVFESILMTHYAEQEDVGC